MLNRRVNHDSPSTPRAFSISGWISSIPGALPLRRCLTTSVTSTREIDDETPSTSSSASNIEGVLFGFRSSSKCSFQRPTTSSVEVNRVPSLLYTAWMVPRFPLLRCRIVFQKHFGADRKSFSMASPNFSHTRCLASDTAATAALRACRYPATESGVLQDIISRKASFFSRTASLTTVVHHGVRGLPPLEEPKTLRPQLATAASAMEALNTAHSGSMPPTSTGMPEKLRRRCELKIPRTGASSRRSQFTRTTRLGLPGLSGNFPHSLIQLTTRWWSVDSSAPLFTRVSKTCGLRSDDTITKSIIDLRPRVLWYQVHL
ncbi:uncharacterized protein LOC132453327 [Gadus macrocephalus]|uniref:uncharacterized protein LOC132453327 n=1 Tax=Gadus macrocephalus TaxID=80720 RepID=UPI0028CB138C|nr:uncharacterized protein LOC132453327 [Gadus macrocephalus]